MLWSCNLKGFFKETLFFSSLKYLAYFKQKMVIIIMDILTSLYSLAGHSSEVDFNQLPVGFCQLPVFLCCGTSCIHPASCLTPSSDLTHWKKTPSQSILLHPLKNLPRIQHLPNYSPVWKITAVLFGAIGADLLPIAYHGDGESSRAGKFKDFSWII